MADLMKKDEMTPAGVTPGGSMAKLYTGSWRTYVPLTELDECVSCMMCWVLCPDSAVLIENEEKVGTDMQFCKGCGVCAVECPKQCIKMMLESEVPEGVKKG
jgi:pyruvate ferredoxin oxidoreductase delta subunit